jgi:eukaryotic-like serine/threonine-protein kinase
MSLLGTEAGGGPSGVLAAGWVLGRYEILRLLSVGGMAEIYLARSAGIAGFEKKVVIKRMLPQFAQHQTFVDMFLGEARLAATLDHSNIVQVYDIGESTGDYYYAMEYVPGVDLRAIVGEERRFGRMVPIAIATAVARGMCAGLDHAHSRTGPDGNLLGIVHRDVSLSNILISYHGAVKVTDFGVAKIASNNNRTRAGMLKGKLGYMSPEQVCSEPLDRRSDVFGIGIVLWELLAARRLFVGDAEFAVLQRIVHGIVPPPSTIRADLPPALEAIVMRALARDRAERYQTAREMQRDLESFARERRLAISDIELGEYMTNLFPASQETDTIDYEAQDGGGDDEGESMRLEVAEAVAIPTVSWRRQAEASTPAVVAIGNDDRRRKRAIAAAAVVTALGIGAWAAIAGGRDTPPAQTAEVAAATPGQPAAPAPTPVPAVAVPSTEPTLPMAAHLPPPPSVPAPAAAAPIEEAPDEVALAGPPDAGIAAQRRVQRPRVVPAPARTAPPPARRAPAPSVATATARTAPELPAPPPTTTAPAPATTPAPAPPARVATQIPPTGPARAPAPPKLGSLDAVPSIGAVDISGGLQGSVVRRTVERVLGGYRDCYRSAARSARRTPEGQVRISFEIDENGLVRDVRANGTLLPGLAACMQNATSRLRTRIAPDVGVAHANIVIAFEPVDP